MLILKRFNALRTWTRSYAKDITKTKHKTKLKLEPGFIRNIGILAHIDAGKTTTTERMLFYAGLINTMGEVHHGNTVTDFMEQERRRGITITAASVSFSWGDFVFNLIDTPGHIDFTMEVEQTLSVLDGALVVLDSSAGVEAQTVTVWNQAKRYGIPRIIYINKMDRADAGFFSSVNSIKSKLNEIPLPLQLPFIQDRVFKGILDVLECELLVWDQDSLGVNISRRKLVQDDGQMWEDAIKARRQLTETLADIDDQLAEHIIVDDQSMETVSVARLRKSIKNVTHSAKAFPLLCGSSYKNIGVQALMDAVIHYLPSPADQENKNTLADCFGNNLCAKVFKVRHDSHKGPLTFLRIYSGVLAKGQKIHNLRDDSSENIGKLLLATADDYEEVDQTGLGSIVAVTGSKHTVTGDVITSSASSAKSAKKKMSDVDIKTMIPEPVFFCSIECSSQAYQTALENALEQLKREDPSLQVRLDSETGQTVLSGMGELHLDVIKERINKEYRIDVQLGPLQIAYKEKLVSAAKDSHVVNLKIGSSQHYVNLTMSVASDGGPAEGVGAGQRLCLDRSPANASNISSIFPKHLLAVKEGVDSGLSRGPKLSCPVVNVKVTLHWLEVGRGTSESVITSATSQCLKKLLSVGGTQLLEPVMELEVICPQHFMPLVTSDLNRRRASPSHFSARGIDKVVVAHVPLSELLGYATHLRSMTSGQASFSMQLHSLQPMLPFDEAKAIKSVTGLDPL